MLHPFLQEKLPAIREIFAAHHVKEAYAFGSVCYPERFTEESDIDLLFSFDETMTEPLLRGEAMIIMLYKLEDTVLKRKIDFLQAQYITNPYLLRSIHRNKVLIYAQQGIPA